MPYRDIKQLPSRVKDNLPENAQEIFKDAFNNAEKEYHKEESAFRVAWSAVKHEYEKGTDGKWHKKTHKS